MWIGSLHFRVEVPAIKMLVFNLNFESIAFISVHTRTSIVTLIILPFSNNFSKTDFYFQNSLLCSTVNFTVPVCFFYAVAGNMSFSMSSFVLGIIIYLITRTGMTSIYLHLFSFWKSPELRRKKTWLSNSACKNGFHFGSELN